ncbi:MULTISPECIES: acyl-CoA carboxylase subunit beta [Micromonospora]|uniref:Acetyl-CoA/propionyl-CoA carboxylase carboxyl transferase subunit n=1 Tax=Micromonospora yangpuensis TaxID=683228 RepID=A0A1C6V293_9ACTN|nr:carboxyl transferase domain-containing protein [Micromonospora yangpuensis]GGL98331.1 putative propionyl-CoA carboxylase beta chain 6 [Micromonospora yangpuensis]SCL60405.1 acetyl-CoA/propionyl-CoA carboxylase carboxyl transferase subunit [Micromonospora yangpuensis]
MTTTAIAADSSTVDHRDPQVRLRALFDAGTLRLLAPPDTSGVLCARGEIEGTPAIAYATDATRMGGAMGTEGCRHIVEAIDTAVRERVPVLGLWHSGGARLAEGVVALDAVGQVFAAMVRASGRVPQISVVFGPAAGGAAYGPALTDIVVMSGGGRIFVTGPEVVRSVTGEQVDMERLGGPEAHGRRSGVVHVTCADDAAALAESRKLAALLGHQGRLSPDDVAGDQTGHDLTAKMPVETNRAYDVKPVVKALLDAPGVELHAKWAPNVVTTLGRFAGRTVGVIANNPLRLGGCLDASSAEKAARFVRMCDSLGVPLIVLVDVPGYLPGLGQEWDGVVRRGAKLLHAFSEAVVPRVTLVTRKAYGGAYIAMNSRSLGATAVFAWPNAEVAVMGASAAVNILHRKKLAAAPAEEREALRAQLIAEQIEVAGGVNRALEIGVVDDVIKPAETRRRIAEALAAAPAARGAHGNIPL